MVTASTRMTPAETDEAAGKSDISLTPMAMPILSGPGSIGVVMGLAANAESMVTYLGLVIGIAALALSVFLFLRLGGRWSRGWVRERWLALPESSASSFLRWPCSWCGTVGRLRQ